MLRVRIGFIIILTVMTGLLLAGNHWFRGARDRAVYAFVTGNLLRLHVVANSNDPADQKLKLKVRDRILKETGELAGVRSRREALAFLADHRGPGQSGRGGTAEARLRRSGAAEIGRYPFPRKSYPSGSCPEASTSPRVVVERQGRIGGASSSRRSAI